MSFNCGPSEFNGAAPSVAPLGKVPGPGVRIPSKRYTIEIEPFKADSSFCHFAVHAPGMVFASGGARSHMFEAVAAAFTAARRMSRASSYPVRVVSGEPAAIPHRPAPLPPAPAAIASPSPEVLPASVCQDTLKTGVSTPALGAPLCGRAVGNGASGKSSNLDLNGRLVKRMRLVSWHGRRGVVRRTSRGHCLVQFIDHKGAFVGSPDWLACNSVQVVA